MSGTSSTPKSVDERLCLLPSTRYYGSKRRLLQWIYSNVQSLSFDSVLDGFGGTASVSLLFKAMGKCVTYNDALNCNSVAAEALLSDISHVNCAEQVASFLDNIKPCQGLISTRFKDIFYTDEENAWLDGAVAAINSLEEKERRYAYFYCLFQACLQKRPYNLFHRANLALRVNQSGIRTFGNHVTWETPFDSLILQAHTELRRANWASGREHTVLAARDICDVSSGYDLVYLDPPYISNSGYRDDYLRRYHFLEGMSKYDEWEDQLNINSKCLSLIPRPHLGKWHDKKQFKKLLFDLIEYHRKSIVVLSYVEDAYPTSQEIILHFSDIFKKSSFATKQISQALSTKKRNEFLIIGLP